MDQSTENKGTRDGAETRGRANRRLSLLLPSFSRDVLNLLIWYVFYFLFLEDVQLKKILFQELLLVWVEVS